MNMIMKSVNLYTINYFYNYQDENMTFVKNITTRLAGGLATVIKYHE